jgi:hypothetical protein
MKKILCLGVVVAVIAVVAGCGGASSNGSDSGANGSGAAASSQAVKFAECMRNHGVKNFPDPDASGQLTIDAVANSSGVDTNTAAFQQAISACKSLEPSGFTGHKRTAEQQVGALRFAQCVRDHGVKDFPDPGPDDPLIDTTRIPSAATNAGIAILNAATKQCSDLAAAAGVTGGR